MSFTDLDRVGESIILSQFWPLLKQASFLGSWGSSKNWLELEIKPPLSNLVCINRWNTLYVFFRFYFLYHQILPFTKMTHFLFQICGPTTSSMSATRTFRQSARLLMFTTLAWDKMLLSVSTSIHQLSKLNSGHQHCQRYLIWLFSLLIMCPFLFSKFDTWKFSFLASIGGPRYMRSFYLRFRIYAIGNWPFLGNLSPTL